MTEAWSKRSASWDAVTARAIFPVYARTPRRGGPRECRAAAIEQRVDRQPPRRLGESTTTRSTRCRRTTRGDRRCRPRTPSSALGRPWRPLEADEPDDIDAELRAPGRQFTGKVDAGFCRAETSRRSRGSASRAARRGRTQSHAAATARATATGRAAESPVISRAVPWRLPTREPDRHRDTCPLLSATTPSVRRLHWEKYGCHVAPSFSMGCDGGVTLLVAIAVPRLARRSRGRVEDDAEGLLGSEDVNRPLDEMTGWSQP